MKGLEGVATNPPIIVSIPYKGHTAAAVLSYLGHVGIRAQKYCDVEGSRTIHVTMATEDLMLIKLRWGDDFRPFYIDMWEWVNGTNYYHGAEGV